MRTLLCCLAFLALAAPIASAGAKEKANKTKCSNALRKMEAAADRGIAKMEVRRKAHLPAVLALREAGQKEAADELAVNALKQIAHHAEQAFDQIDAIADACIAEFRDDDSDGDSIDEIEAAREHHYKRVLISRRTNSKPLGG